MPSLRACDCCSRRKVRCDRQKPCQNCQKSDLFCSYASKPKKRGPKGPTKIIQELRLLQAQQQIIDPAPTSHDHIRSRNDISANFSSSDDADHFFRNGLENTAHRDYSSSSAMDYEDANIPSPATSHSSGSPAHSPEFSYHSTGIRYFPDPVTGTLIHPNPVFKPDPFLTHGFASTCASIFFQNLYPIMPIFDRSRFNSTYLANCHTSPQCYALVTSMCALTLIQLCAVPDESEAGGENLASWESAERLGISSGRELEKVGKTLLSEALRARRFFEYIAKPDLDTVITSFFLFCSYGNLENHDHAWYYLRESISFAQGIGLDDEKTYWRAKAKSESNQSRRGYLSETERWRRMFWLLFITERAYAIQRHHPLTLRKAIALPKIPENHLQRENSRSPSSTPERDIWDEEPPAVDEDETMSEAQVLSNFVTLATLFQNMDDVFVTLWNHASDVSEMLQSPEALVDTEYLSQGLMKLNFSNSWVEKLHQQLESIGTRAMGADPDNGIPAGERQHKSTTLTFDNSGMQSYNTAPSYNPASKPPSVATTVSVSSFMPIQKADILVSRQWLHLIIWRLSVEKVRWLRKHNKSRALSVTGAPEPHQDDCESDVLSLAFPVKIAKGVLDITAKVTVEALEAHGIGMQEKLFDIGCSLANVIRGSGNSQQLARRLTMQERTAFEFTRRHYLHEIVRVLSELRGGKSRFFHAILQRVDGALEMSSPCSNGRDLVPYHSSAWEPAASNYDRRIEEVEEIEEGTQSNAQPQVSRGGLDVSHTILCNQRDDSYSSAGAIQPLIENSLNSDIYYNNNTTSLNHNELQSPITGFNPSFDNISPHPSALTGDNIGFLQQDQSMSLGQLYGTSSPFSPVQDSYLAFTSNLPLETLQTPQSSAPPSVASFQSQDYDCDNINNSLATFFSSTGASAPPSIATVSTARSSNVSTRRNSFSASDIMYSTIPTQSYAKHPHFQYEPVIGEEIMEEEEIATKTAIPTIHHNQSENLRFVEYPTSGTQWGYM